MLVLSVHPHPNFPGRSFSVDLNEIPAFQSNIRSLYMNILITMHPPKGSWTLVLKVEQVPEPITGTEGPLEDGGF